MKSRLSTRPNHERQLAFSRQPVKGGWTNPSLTQSELDSSCQGQHHTVDEILVNPGHATFIRNDNIADARYRAFSVREISPLN